MSLIEASTIRFMKISVPNMESREVDSSCPCLSLWRPEDLRISRREQLIGRPEALELLFAAAFVGVPRAREAPEGLGDLLRTAARLQPQRSKRVRGRHGQRISFKGPSKTPESN